jgi:hypothetical protein
MSQVKSLGGKNRLCSYNNSTETNENDEMLGMESNHPTGKFSLLTKSGGENFVDHSIAIRRQEKDMPVDLVNF